MIRISRLLRVRKTQPDSSPVAFHGNIDGVSDGRVDGWIKTADRPAPLAIDVVIDGQPVLRGVTAMLTRTDVAEAGFGSGQYGFSCQVPYLAPDESPWDPGRDYTVAIHQAGEAVPALTGIFSGSLLQPVPAPADEAPSSPLEPPLPDYEARLEKVTATELCGWVIDRTNPDRVVKVDILVDGVVLRQALGDGMRGDLLRAGKSMGHGGLRVPLKLALLGAGTYCVALRLPDGQVLEREVQISAGDTVGFRPGRSEAIRPDSVAIIVPVYNAAEDVALCIERLNAHTPAEVEILFIDDASPDPAIAPLLAEAAQRPSVRVLRNDENLGFTRTVNRGLEAVGRKHAILLNSDARVTPGWVEGLLAAAASRSFVATVTPMSDRAGAFSAPQLGNDNALPPGVGETTYATAFRRRALGIYPLVPTGNGFCMFVNRACLDDVGLLDAEAFPRGYGEENDFCMRAGRAGWLHLVDDRTYVFHERSASFGAAKTELIRAGRAVIDARYPEYKQAIRVFSHGAELELARLRARQALADCAEPRATLPRVLFVVAAQNGGTAQTNMDLMKALAGHCDPWLLRSDGRKIELSRVIGDGLQPVAHHVLAQPVEPIRHVSEEYDEVVADWIRRHDFGTVHIRHLAFHSLNLPRLAKDAGCVTVFSFHDFYMLCPSVKLLDADGRYYGGDLTRLARPVMPELWPAEQMPVATPGWIAHWRLRAGRALAVCDAFVTTSASARDTVLAHLPDIAAERFHIISHGRDFPAFDRLRRAPRHGEPLRILVPGGIGVAKGLAVIRDLLAEDRDGLLEFHILGSTSREVPLDDPRVIRHGLYQRDEFAARVRGLDIHLGAVFSIWDETWCHTLTELWSIGVPALVFDFPTVAGRVRETGAGWVLDHRDIPALYRDILGLAFDAGEQDRADAAIAAWQRGLGIAATTGLMSARYLNLYRQAGGQLEWPIVGVLVGDADGPAAPCARRTDGPILPVPMPLDALLANLAAGTLDGVMLAASAIPVTARAELAATLRAGTIPSILWLDTDGDETSMLTRTVDRVLISAPSSEENTPRLAANLSGPARWEDLFTPASFSGIEARVEVV